MYNLFLDIKDACDNVFWDILIPKLINLRLPFSFIEFINHLSCLEQHFRYNDIMMIVRNVYRGLLQGCVLKRLFHYLILILKFFRTRMIYTLCIKSDQCNNGSRGSKKFGSGLIRFLGLSLAPDKSQLCIFKRTGNDRNRRSTPNNVMLYEKLGNPKWKRDLNFSIVSINRLRSGHTVYLDTIYVVDSSLYDCGEIQCQITFWQCSLLNKKRNVLLQTLNDLNFMSLLCIELFLHLLRLEIIYALTNFIDVVSFRF
ncbi:hypothetical protein ACFW04_014618 [Cataglyphis niger]